MNPPIAHLYVHVPFCGVKCEYCAFLTHVGSLRLLPAYLDALEREAEMVLGERHAALQTVYFGGGTPSLMSPEDVSRLLNRFDRLAGPAAGREVTLECHPLTVDLPKLAGFRRAGVTRLSIGGESLDGRELERLGRRHAPGRVLEVVGLARTAGFDSINVDLMYGLPGQTEQSWQRTLDTLAAAQPDHLSLYPLQIEPRTVFARKLKKGLLYLPPDEAVAEMYGQACSSLQQAGYRHYEVASWAIPGHRCAHNLAYWLNREFFALGVGAHGYVKPYRTENVRRTRRYIERVAAGERPVEARTFVDPATELAETVMLRLRLLEDGLDLRAFERQFGFRLDSAYASDIAELAGAGLLEVDRELERIRLPEAAVPVANEVWQRFMWPAA